MKQELIYLIYLELANLNEKKVKIQSKCLKDINRRLEIKYTWIIKYECK